MVGRASEWFFSRIRSWQFYSGVIKHFYFLPSGWMWASDWLNNILLLPLTLCRMQGIQKYPFGTTSVRTAPLTKKDELHMPGPTHYQKQPQLEQGVGGGGGEGGANGKPSVRTRRSSHTFATVLLVLSPWVDPLFSNISSIFLRAWLLQLKLRVPCFGYLEH